MVAGTGKRGFDALIDAPFGTITVRVEAARVTDISVLVDGTGEVPALQPVGVAASAAREIVRYLADGRHRMQFAFTAQGTAYQRRIWRAMMEIPSGSTTTYGELAQRAGGSARSVAMACRDNPLALLIPCHRVVARDGLGGYMGATGGRRLEIKRWLLGHERNALRAG